MGAQGSHAQYGRTCPHVLWQAHPGPSAYRRRGQYAPNKTAPSASSRPGITGLLKR